MPKFRATVRFFELDGRDPASVQQALDERLKQTGLERWRVMSIQAEGASTQRAAPGRVPSNEAARGPSGGGLLLVAAAAWVIWFFWFLAE